MVTAVGKTVVVVVGASGDGATKESSDCTIVVELCTVVELRNVEEVGSGSVELVPEGVVFQN